MANSLFFRSLTSSLWRRSQILMVLAVGQLAILHAGCSERQSTPTSEEMKVEEPLAEVKIRALEETDLFDSLWFGGHIQAKVDFQVLTEKSGTIIQSLVTLGQKVEVGKRLIALKPDTLGLAHRNYWIKAPISGIVSEIDIEPGYHLKSYQRVLKIADDREYFVNIMASYEESLKLDPGKSVDILMASGTPMEKSFVGKIQETSPSADEMTGLYRIKIALQCQAQKEAKACQQLAKIGSFVKVLYKDNQRKGIQVDPDTLSQRNSQVLLVNDKGVVEARKVEFKSSADGRFEITKGLEVGEKLITAYKNRPRAGDQVKIISDSIAANADKSEKS